MIAALCSAELASYERIPRAGEGFLLVYLVAVGLFARPLLVGGKGDGDESTIVCLLAMIYPIAHVPYTSHVRIRIQPV